MSRIRVLNLPLNLKESQVRSFFQAKVSPSAPDMTITDVYIKRDHTNPAKSTMLFVGFKTSKAGEFAVKHFHGAFMGAQKLHVETAAGLNEAPKSHKERMEERKRERDERVEAAKKRQADKEKSVVGFDKDGKPSEAKKQRKEAFVNARMEGAGGPSWASELLLPHTEGVAVGGSATEKEETEEAYADVKKEHARSLKKRIEREKLEKAKKVIDEARLLMSPDCEEGEEKENINRNSTGLSDLDFLNSLAGGEDKDDVKRGDDVKATSNNVLNDDHTCAGSASASHSNPSSCAPNGGFLGMEDTFQQEETPEDICRETRRVHIGNIPYIASEDDVRNYVSSQVGPIEHLHIPLTKDTKDSKGSAFITFVHSCDAVAALTTLKGAVFMGRLLRISAAKPDPHAQKGGGVYTSSSGEGGASDLQESSGKAFRAKKAEELRKTDQKGLNWNTTYMSSHAAVKIMADKLKVDASDIVSVDAKGAAVRAAVAEAFLTSEAKMVLGDEGICFEAIQQSSATLHKQRSNTTILVKNLSPMQTKEQDYLDELVKLFKKFGALENIAAPSSRVFALFAFLHPQDARVAFQRLSYRKFKGAPLFLEWAPLGSLNDDVNNATTGAGNSMSSGHEGASAAHDKLSVYALFLSNLPISGKGTTGVSDQVLLEFIFEYCPKVARNKQNYIKAIRILEDKGQAFITCVDEYSQGYILARLNDKPLMGRAITVKISSSAPKKAPTVNKGGDDVDDTVEKGAVSSSHANSSTVPTGCDPHKIIVKNLPFEATEKDLRELFAAFSDVKSVRVPQKVHQFGAHRENNHRGFGFVEFLTEQEAALALKTLSATHLYGRHLVLQYAKKEGA